MAKDGRKPWLILGRRPQNTGICYPGPNTIRRPNDPIRCSGIEGCACSIPSGPPDSGRLRSHRGPYSARPGVDRPERKPDRYRNPDWTRSSFGFSRWGGDRRTGPNWSKPPIGFRSFFWRDKPTNHHRGTMRFRTRSPSVEGGCGKVDSPKDQPLCRWGTHRAMLGQKHGCRSRRANGPNVGASTDRKGDRWIKAVPGSDHAAWVPCGP